MKKYNLFLRILVISFLVSLSLAAKKESHLGYPVTFRTIDQIIISGLYKPANSPDKKTFILLHGLGSNQDEWQPFAQQLVAQGCGFLSYDARGHGESVRTADGKQITYQSFGPPGDGSPWSKMTSDLGEAVLFLVKEKKVQEKNIGIIGASIGANVALIYAVTNKNIPVVVLLSPGLNYVGFDTREAIRLYRQRPLVIAASPGDAYAFQSSQFLYRQIQENRQAIFITAEKGHGVQMFEKKFTKTLLKYIRGRS